MKPENLAGVLGSRNLPVRTDGEKRLKLDLEAQAGGAVGLHCQGRIIFGPEARALTDIVADVLPTARPMGGGLFGGEIVGSARPGRLVLFHIVGGACGPNLKFSNPFRS